MTRVLQISLLMFISLYARENPFFPSKNDTDTPTTTNQISVIEPLKRATLTLPSTARIINSVTITYKNLDGSIKSKTESLGNSVDWHLPIFISQNINNTEKSFKKIRRPQKSQKFERLLSLSFIGIYESQDILKIVTKDKMLRNFLLTKPHRIVCDFKRDIDIRSYEKYFKKRNRVKSVRVGNHKGYYRVVIELDGHYKYSIQEMQKAYFIRLL